MEYVDMQIEKKIALERFIELVRGRYMVRKEREFIFPWWG